jgi:hypothetical protein
VGCFRYSLQALAFLRTHKGVTAEAFTDPLAALSENTFCGLFPDVDAVFGGLKPFGKEGGGGDAELGKRGGSIACIPPLEFTLASNYLRKSKSACERSERKNSPTIGAPKREKKESNDRSAPSLLLECSPKNSPSTGALAASLAQKQTDDRSAVPFFCARFARALAPLP